MPPPLQKPSAMRRETVLRPRAGSAPKMRRWHLSAALGPLRVFFLSLAVSLAIAFAERGIASAVAGWFGFVPKFDTGLPLFPCIAGPAVLAMVYSPQVAVANGLATAAVLWSAMRFNPCTLVCALAGIFLTAAFAPRIRRTGDLAILVLHVFALQAILAVAVFAVCHSVAPSIETCEGWHLGALLFLAVLSVPFTLWVALPIAEFLARRTSDYSLASFASLENPLLQRLSREAPGTYGHSMAVADLAFAAADAIGANSLLARLGGYYHDIGKLSNPRYFMENQTLLGNPHDALPPSVSVMIIASHVKDGLILAREAGLPRRIVGIIASHHGTSAMEWFRLKAQKLSGDDSGNDSWPYRYGGPLPESREETIVSIADGIEAASRSLSAPSRPEIARLVGKTVAARQADGQFAKSALTMAELETVKETIIEVLVHRLHARAAYPPEKH